jgi:glycine C-acetyltransferase
MPLNRFVDQLAREISDIDQAGTAKGFENVVRKIIPAHKGEGPRVLLVGEGDQPFLRMNSNSYLGMSTREKVIKAEEDAARKYGVGPGGVRFISGTYEPHIRLEERLARFHGREACMVTSSAYTCIMGMFVTLTTPETIIVSDELNHNSIINAMRLARPKEKKVYSHLNMADLEFKITDSIGQCDSLIVITDGVFSMRGAYAPLDQLSELCEKYDSKFPRGIVLVVDDSHGVGALGRTGRGTEEMTSATGVDIVVATLGKALGVNGGYIASKREVIRYLREKSPFYIYTNPITSPEAMAALAALEILDSPEGVKLITHLRQMTEKFSHGLLALGYETIDSVHPVVPLMVRDTARTSALVTFLREHYILATGLNFPIVPKGDQLIRFQVTADHTESDIDYVLSVLKKFAEM